MKKIAVLGSTGSIGVNALKVIKNNPEAYQVVALAAGSNVKRLLQQIEIYHPLAVAVAGEDAAKALEKQLDNENRPDIFIGPQGYSNLVALDEVDTVISAMTGAAGLVPTYAAIQAGKGIALANKETLVMAGGIIMAQAKKKNATILPIDSEHSAILQSLQGHPKEDLRHIILTASGGPFRELTSEQLAAVTPDEALQHPNWDMGRKVTIDSATLMNKGLEVIEAKWLFDLEMAQIKIMIHPESIVHSMVEYQDGSVIAQMGVPDMITPISYALSYPRHRNTHLAPLKLDEIGALHFFRPDKERFRCLALALDAAEIGESMPAVLNGANEIAVDAFLREEIGFLGIPRLIEDVMEAHKTFPVHTVEDVLEADHWARERAQGLVLQLRT
ncbi:MAG: 1-deoxy-D-xylulose-5-phosphate reductoisomerase [Deltaproteobacteria bacterium]|nr:1-deoxy-D-xylulose-5-phosphate reductoisomerase [Deltaproteobacteria bacterium]